MGVFWPQRQEDEMDLKRGTRIYRIFTEVAMTIWWRNTFLSSTRGWELLFLGASDPTSTALSAAGDEPDDVRRSKMPPSTYYWRQTGVDKPVRTHARANTRTHARVHQRKNIKSQVDLIKSQPQLWRVLATRVSLSSWLSLCLIIDALQSTSWFGQPCRQPTQREIHTWLNQFPPFESSFFLETMWQNKQLWNVALC